MHKTSAWPLALAYAALIVYASLYPFGEWRDQGVSPLVFLAAPLPKYWTGFDVTANVLGYAPLGFLLAVGMLRSGRPGAVLVAFTAGTTLSLAMECLQIYLPRVPSNVDLALNMGGALLGALLAVLADRLGAVARWSRFRDRWFVAEARGALVLLALWPPALLAPAAVPFGLGQMLERLEVAAAEAVADTPFIDWLPVRETALLPLVPGAELLCVLFGLIAPCLLAFSVVRGRWQRLVLAAAVLAAGICTTALSAGLSYGPAHAWEWLNPPVQAGLWAAPVAVALLALLPRRVCAALVIPVLVMHLSLLNGAPTSPYFAQTLQTWEQGRFIRFQGLAQWLGWGWPYAALVSAVTWLARRPAEPKIGP